MPNGDENGIDLQSFTPSWQEDGLGISGEQTDFRDDDAQDWDTDAWTADSPDIGEVRAGGGLTVQTGPFSGGYTGTVDGVSTITLDERYFLIQDNGGGEVLISLNTTNCP